MYMAVLWFTVRLCEYVQEPPTQEEKDCYLKKAAEFAVSLAASLQEPDACRLYCPAFKSSACQCLQKYISADGNEVFLFHCILPKNLHGRNM
jgi:hypothetical protein